MVRSETTPSPSADQRLACLVPKPERVQATTTSLPGVCRSPGAPNQPRNGKGDAYAYRKTCHPGAIAPPLDTRRSACGDARLARYRKLAFL